MKGRKSLAIRLISDTHFEPVVNEQGSKLGEAVLNDLIALGAEGRGDSNSVLVLAGDIGNPYTDPYRRFLLAAKAVYRHVLLVPGNHEYYLDGAKDMGVVKEHLGRLARDTGVTLLDNSDVVIQGIRFVGSTCWPIVPEEQFKVLKREGYGLVTRITKDSHRLDFSDFKRLHDMDVNYLEGVVTESKEPCVIITHYPPTAMMLDERYEHSPQVALHANDGLIDRVAKTQGTPLWLCGHCHTAKKMWVRGMNTVLAANCIEGGEYDSGFVFSLQI